MAKERFDLSAPKAVLLALKYSAQQCNAPLSAWIAFCCCSKLTRKVANTLPSRHTKKPTREPPKVSVKDIEDAGCKATRETLSCPAAYRDAWAEQATAENRKLSPWIIECCSCYLHPEVRLKTTNPLAQDHGDDTAELGFKLMSLYYQLDDNRSQNNWLQELGVADIALASHLPIASPILINELHQITDRLLELCNCDDRFLMGDSEIDSKLRYYYCAIKRKFNPTQAERQASRESVQRLTASLGNARMAGRKRSSQTVPQVKKRVPITTLQLCRNERFSDSFKLERIRTFKILFQLQQLASQGATQEQVLQGQDHKDRFVQYVSKKIGGTTDLPGSLKQIYAKEYLIANFEY
jgi:hypothetical protein